MFRLSTDEEPVPNICLRVSLSHGSSQHFNRSIAVFLGMMEAMLQHLKMKRTLAAAAMGAAAKKAAADAALAAKKAAQDPAQKAARDGAVWKQVQEPAAHITPATWCAPEMVGCSDAEINRRSLEGYMVRSKRKTGCLQLSYEEGDKSKGHAGAEKVKPGEKKTKNQRGRKGGLFIMAVHLG